MAQKDVELILTFTDKSSAKVRQALAKVEGTLKQHGVAVSSTTKGYEAFGKSTEGATDSTSKMGGMFKSTMMQMAAGMGIMIGVQGAMRLIGTTIRGVMTAGREFESAWANTTTMLSISQEETDKLKTELIGLSPVLGDTTMLAKGMYQVLSASVEPAKAIEFLGFAAKSAQAGVTDTTTAVDALTTVINAYGMEAEDVTAVSDIMFQTVKRGKLTYEGMAGALGTVAPIAARVGIGFEEVAAAMATLTRQGIDVNTTTVQLRQVMVSVLKPTAEAEKAAKELGIEFSSAALRAKGLSAFLQDIDDKTRGDADALTALFGNVRALTGVMGLAGESAKDFAGDIDLMNNAAGSTEEAFKKQMKTTDFWIKTFQNAMGKMKIAMYEGLTSSVKAGMSSMDDLERKMDDLVIKARNAGRDIAFSLGVIGRLLTPQRQIGEVMVEPFFGGKSSRDMLKEAKRALYDMLDQIDAYAVGLKVLTISQDELEQNFLKTTSKLKDLGLEVVYYANSLGIVIDENTAWRDTITEVDTALAKQKAGYAGHLGLLANTIKASQDHVAAMLAQSDSAEEFNERYRNYRKLLEDGVKPIKETTKALTELEKLTKSLGLTLKKDLESRMEDVTKVLKNYRKELTTGEEKKLEKELFDLRDELGLVETGYKDVQAALKLLNKEMKDSKESTVTGADALANILGPTLDDIVGKFEEVEEILPELVTEFDELGRSAYTIAQMAKKGVDGVKKAVKPLPKLMESLADDIADSFGDVLANLLLDMEDIGDFLEGLTEQFFRAFTKNISAAFFAWSKSWGSAGAIASKEMRAVEVAVENVGDTMTSVAYEASDIVEAMASAFRAYVISGLLQHLVSIFEGTEDHLKLLSAEMQKELQEMAIWAKDTADKVIISMEQLKKSAAIDASPESTEVSGIRGDEDSWEVRLDMMNKSLEDLAAAEVITSSDLKKLNDDWGDLISQARFFGLEGSKAFTDMIKKMRELGLESQALDDYVFGWLETGSEGLMAMVEGAGESAAELERIGNLISLTFASAQAQGMSTIEAFAMVEEPLRALVEKQRELGQEGGAATQQLMKILDVKDANEGLFAAIQGNVDILMALGNTGFLTQDALTDVATQAQLYYEQLKASGLTANEALALMAPTLSEIQRYAEENNLTIDAGTQSLIDQAAAGDLLTEGNRTMTQVLADGFDDVVVAIEGLVAVLTGSGGVTEAMGEVIDMAKGMEDIVIPGMTVEPPGGGGGFVQPAIQAAGGFHGYVDTAVQPFVAHRGEYVNVSTPQEIRSSGGGVDNAETTRLLRELIGAVKEGGGSVVIPELVVGDALEQLLIRFIPQATKNEILLVHPNGVKES